MNFESTQRVAAGEEVAGEEESDAVDWTVRSWARGSWALSWVTVDSVSGEGVVVRTVVGEEDGDAVRGTQLSDAARQPSARQPR